MGNPLRAVVLVAAVQAAIVVLWLSCGGCAPPPAPVTTVSRPTWPAGSFPVELRLSSALHPCQRAAMLSAVAWWESRAGIDLFDPRDVPSDDAAVLGIPQARVVSVSPAPNGLSSPYTLGEATPWHRYGGIWAVEVQLATCSPRVAAHEAAHALGLPHRINPLALMHPTHGSVDSWDINEAELAIVRAGGASAEVVRATIEACRLGR